jgi:hypothetical protein
MDPSPLDWTALKSIALWVIEGPRSIVSSPEPTGGPSGWVERMMHWQVHPTDGLTESRTVFRRPIYEGMTLPPFVLRVATWDKKRDRFDSREQLVEAISLQAEHFEFNETSVAQVLACEKELASCLMEISADESVIDDSGSLTLSDAMYRWSFPGRRITHDMSWLSSPKTSYLERLWKETLPKTNGLPRLTGLIERFEVDPFGTYVDAVLEQMPTIHHLL